MKFSLEKTYSIVDNLDIDIFNNVNINIDVGSKDFKSINSLFQYLIENNKIDDLPFEHITITVHYDREAKVSIIELLIEPVNEGDTYIDCKIIINDSKDMFELHEANSMYINFENSIHEKFKNRFKNVLRMYKIDKLTI